MPTPRVNPTLWAECPELRAVALLIGAGLPGAPAQPARLPDKLNWMSVVTLALAHNSAGLLHRAIAAGAAPGLPPPLATAISRHAAMIAARNGAAMGEMQRLLAAFAAAHIPALPLKGAWLCQRVYGDLAARPSRDIDLLLPPDAIDRALAVLDACGYPTDTGLTHRQLHAKCRYAGQLVFQRADGAFVVEPHWALAPRTLSVDIDHPGLWARARPEHAGTLTLPTLAPEDEFIMLCMHGYKEEWARLKWLSDLAGFVASHPDLDTAIITARAKSQGLWWMVLVGLALIGEVFAIPPPQRACDGRWPADAGGADRAAADGRVRAHAGADRAGIQCLQGLPHPPGHARTPPGPRALCAAHRADAARGAFPHNPAARPAVSGVLPAQAGARLCAAARLDRPQAPTRPHVSEAASPRKVAGNPPLG
jgi:hypothetical protein